MFLNTTEVLSSPTQLKSYLLHTKALNSIIVKICVCLVTNFYIEVNHLQKSSPLGMSTAWKISPIFPNMRSQRQTLWPSQAKDQLHKYFVTSILKKISAIQNQPSNKNLADKVWMIQGFYKPLGFSQLLSHSF